MEENKSNTELLYNTAPDTQIYNNIYNDLKIVFVEYMKARFPSLAALSALKEDKLMKIEEERLNKLIYVAQDNIKKIDKNKIDYNFIRTEEFARVVFNIFDKAKSDYRKEKLKYYANILINYSTIDFSKDFYKEGLIDKISKLSCEHLIVLNEFYNIYLNYDYATISKELKNLPKGSVNWKSLKLNGIKQNIIELCLVDLQAEGLLYNLASFRFDGAVNEEFAISTYGIKCINLINENYKN